jgi:hypothetical protein
VTNNILIGAEGIDGANFLACCLTMSDEVYFDNCTLEEKIKFFFRGMADIEKINGIPIWSDVSMLFHSFSRGKNNLIFSTYQSKKIHDSLNSTKTLISKVSMPQLLPLRTLMSKDPEDPLVQLFESKYFIVLVNPDLFISLRTILDNEDSSVPNLDSFTIEKFNSLPKREQETIKSGYQSDIERLFAFRPSGPTLHSWNMHNMKCDIDYRTQHDDVDMDAMEEIFNKSKDFMKPLITHQWDCNWFLNEDDTVENIKLLYSEMNLGKVNEKLIRKMYNVWVERMDYIKKSHIKEFESAINNGTFVSEY